MFLVCGPYSEKQSFICGTYWNLVSEHEGGRDNEDESDEEFFTEEACSFGTMCI